jgi:hypothetical protein
MITLQRDSRKFFTLAKAKGSSEETLNQDGQAQ